MNKEIILETKNYIKELKIAGIRNDLNEMIAESYGNNTPYEELLRDFLGMHMICVKKMAVKIG